LQELQCEFEVGQKMLVEMEHKRENLEQKSAKSGTGDQGGGARGKAPGVSVDERFIQQWSHAMRGQLEQRLQQLKAEFETGQKMLTDLEQKRANLEQTLLRISGAIQVLEEVLAAEKVAENSAEPVVDATTAHAR
jgi:DNA repair exonuclease SbcCD ATPase subunit